MEAYRDSDDTGQSRRSDSAAVGQHDLRDLDALVTRLSEAIEDGDTPFASTLVYELQRQVDALIKGRSS